MIVSCDYRVEYDQDGPSDFGPGLEDVEYGERKRQNQVGSGYGIRDHEKPIVEQHISTIKYQQINQRIE